MVDETLDYLQGLCVLIVEDEYTIASELAHWFEEAGAEIVGPVGSVRKALALVTVDIDRVDAAVLDVNLRDERVFPVADALTAARVPFIFATGYDAGIIPDIYADVPRCEKPVDMTQLARVLAKVVGI
jgi:DNA-binding NtrC family response regulator